MFKILNKILKKVNYWKFIYSNPLIVFNDIEPDSSKIMILTIAFNEPSFIEYQIKLLNKYFKDPFYLIVVDNSSNLFIRESIQSICKANQISYAGVPLCNPYIENKSHAAAMHWSYFQLVRKNKVKIFGFLDHDIFPISSFSILDRMRGGIYGRVIHAYSKGDYQYIVSSEVPYWSLWAGFCFFENEKVKGPFPWSLNFFSKHFPKGYFLDTGGGLWDSLYRKMSFPGDLASYELKPFSDEKTGIQNQSFEILDGSWIHFVSLSNWRTISEFDKKMIALDNMLQTALNKT